MKKIFGSGPTTAKPPSGDSNDLRISGASIDTKKYVPPGYQIRDRDLRKIHRAASEGKVAKVQQILLLGENGLNDTDQRKRTALHLACANGHAEVVTLLVERKCQLNLYDDENRTALMKAVQGLKEQCAVILLKHGADPNLKDICGNTALHYAVCDENISIVKKLLSHNADIEATNKDNFTPLLLAINANQQEMVEFLVKKKANVHAVDKIKRTTLMLALRNGSTNMVRRLLGKGVDVCCRDHYGWTAHDYARINGSVPNIQLVIQYEQKQMCKNSSQNYPEIKSAEDDSLSSISSLSNKPGPGDPWPLSEDSNLELGVKNIPKPDLSKPISLAQHYRKFLEEKYGIVKPENKPMCEDNNFDGNRENETHPEPSLKKGATEPKIGNGEKGVMPASEFEKEHTESPWELESVSESVSLKCVGPLPEATGEKGEKMLNGHVADSAEKSPHFKSIEPTIEIKDSVVDQAFRRKDVQTSISGVMPASELEKEDTRSPWDTESISESIILKCLGPLPEPTDEKREKMLNGHVADSAEKSPHLKPTEPTFEIKDSAADKALGRKDVHTSRSDFLSLWKIKDTLLSFERLLQLKTNHCNRLIRKNKEMKNEVSRLQKELSETKEMKSQLEHEKVEWEQELCSLRSTLKDEQERRRSTDGLYEKIRDELRRRKEQYKKQREVKRELELSVRTLDTELKTVKNQLNQVTNSHGGEEDLLNKIHMLQDEIAMLKVEAVVRQLQQDLAVKKSMLKALLKDLSVSYTTLEDETLGPIMRQIQQDLEYLDKQVKQGAARVYSLSSRPTEEGIKIFSNVTRTYR